MSGSSRTTVAEAENLDGFEWFGPAPPASLGSAYLTLASTSPEDRGARWKRGCENWWICEGV